ncbi:Quinoprotein amine dehydrogenase beta chain-like [Trinorchestia longiramus]|nr:Quinoprotein amine dehydrogenase beta chain-like [Trinorchestia longiramus]
MDKSKNIIKLTSTSAASTTFQPLSAIPVSARIRSILEVVGKNVHLCSLSEDGTHLAVLEHHTDVLEHHTDVLVRGTLLGEAERAKIGQPADDCVSSSQSVKKNEAQQGSEIGKQATVIFVIDLQSGWCSRLGSIVGLCSVAVFHTRAPLLAVLQPPHRVHIYHVELRCCCEVIEFSNVTDALLGLQWLPHRLVSPRQPGEMLPPETSSGSVSSAVQKAGDESDARSAGASGLLSFSPCELVTFRSPVPCERLSVQPSVYWAGTVLDGTTVVLVREDGTLELLPLTGGTALPLPPLPGLSLHLPVISVSLMSCGRILLVVLRERRVVWCDVKERTMSLISLDTPASPSVLRSAVALSTSHPRYPQVSNFSILACLSTLL